jgi:hypothetical protein
LEGEAVKIGLVIASGILIALCIFIWSRVRSASRCKAIRHYVDEHNLRFLGSVLPDTLNLGDSSLRRAEAISSAFMGTHGKKDFVFFNCFIPAGKTGYTQSVLAIYRLGESYPACRFDRELREERAGDWTLIYHDRREWPLQQIDAHVSSI